MANLGRNLERAMSTFLLQFTWRYRKQKFTMSKTSAVNPLPESHRSSQFSPLENEIVYLGRNSLIPFPPSHTTNTSPRPSRNKELCPIVWLLLIEGVRALSHPLNSLISKKTLPNLSIKYIHIVTQQLFIVYLLCTMPTTVLEAIDTKVNNKKKSPCEAYLRARHVSIFFCPFSKNSAK